MKKFLACVLSASMMLGLLAGCAGAGSSSGNAPASSGAAVSTPAVSGDNVLKIGVFEPSTGDSASGGKKEMLGMRYTVCGSVVRLSSFTLGATAFFLVF